MNRRKLLSSIPVAMLAGCTSSEENERNTERGGVDSHHEIEDGIVEISGTAGYTCHSGFVDIVEINIVIRVDGKIEHEHRKKVHVNACGQNHDWSYSYRPEGDEWSTVDVKTSIYDTYEK